MTKDILYYSSLYVGDLHENVDEIVLYDHFRTFGKLISIRVCRDFITNKSLGYAYVNFKNECDANVAIDNMNLEKILETPCRVMWSERDCGTRKSNVANIFIKNLDLSITDLQIYDTFVNFGEITSCKVAKDEKGMSKGFAFINFKEESDALKAIEIVNGKMIENKIVYVGKFIPQNEKEDKSKSFTNCFIKNFGTSLNDESLKKLFEKFGDIVSSKVMLNDEGVSKGFGFVNFKKHEDAVKAIESLNGTLVEDQLLYVGEALKKNVRKTKMKKQKKDLSSVNLYVKNFNKNITDEELKEMFSIFGNIKSAAVMVDEESKCSKGFGFVCFSNMKDAKKAICKMNGKFIDGKNLYVTFAVKKEDRANILCLQFDQQMNALKMMKNNAEKMNGCVNGSH